MTISTAIAAAINSKSTIILLYKKIELNAKLIKLSGFKHTWNSLSLFFVKQKIVFQKNLPFFK